MALSKHSNANNRGTGWRERFSAAPSIVYMPAWELFRDAACLFQPVRMIKMKIWDTS